MRTTNWKNYTSDLRALAHDVLASAGAERVNARTAAQVLSGVIGLVCTRFGVEVMQKTCAEIVRYTPAWSTDLGRLPLENGQIGEPTKLIAVVARGVLPLCGHAALQQALAYWATERDPAKWKCLCEKSTDLDLQ